MPINPITLDKLEPFIIKQLENKMVDRIIHEVKGSEIKRENKNKKENFNEQKQEESAEKFGYFLSKFNIKFEYKISKNKVKVKIKDKDGNLLIETEVDDIEELFDKVRKDTGSIIDLKG